MKKLEVIMCKGAIAAGKSSWARKMCESGDYVRVNKDDIRDQIFNGKWNRGLEKTVMQVEEAMARAALSGDKSVIIDSTNFAAKHEARFRRVAEEFGAEFSIKLFEAPLSECIRRDSLRPKPVGEKAIRQMFDQYIRPNLPKQDETLPSCYIFDLDGTLAKMSDRSPYEWEKVGQDKVNVPVAIILNCIRRIPKYKVFVMSGRDGSCLELSKQWLQANGIEYDDIFMRAAGDSRKDSIIKRELYEQHIKGKYYVAGWFDDRDQVVAMVRDELNLPCFQVDWGNF